MRCEEQIRMIIYLCSKMSSFLGPTVKRDTRTDLFDRERENMTIKGDLRVLVQLILVMIFFRSIWIHVCDDFIRAHYLHFIQNGFLCFSMQVYGSGSIIILTRSRSPTMSFFLMYFVFGVIIYHFSRALHFCIQKCVASSFAV